MLRQSYRFPKNLYSQFARAPRQTSYRPRILVLRHNSRYLQHCTRSCELTFDDVRVRLSFSTRHHRALGPRSKWYGYLRSLPTRFDLPICWDVWVNGKAKQPSHVLANDMQDMADALSWMRGTEAEKILRRNQCESNVTFVCHHPKIWSSVAQCISTS